MMSVMNYPSRGQGKNILLSIYRYRKGFFATGQPDPFRCLAGHYLTLIQITSKMMKVPGIPLSPLSMMATSPPTPPPTLDEILFKPETPSPPPKRKASGKKKRRRFSKKADDVLDKTVKEQVRVSGN